MDAKTFIIPFLAAAGACIPAVALADDAGPATFTVRNDTGRAMTCAVRKTGRTVGEDVVLRSEQVWTQTYPKGGTRAFRCLDAAPVWYVIRPGLTYRLAANRDGLIVLTSGR